jgi:hypothetical protein
MKIQLPATFSKITSRADSSFKIEFETRELGSEAAALMGLLNNEGWLLFSPNELQEADVPDEKADSMTGQKTKSQRLRGVIFKIWESRGSNGSFETFYQNYMETIIEQLKEKIG